MTMSNTKFLDMAITERMSRKSIGAIGKSRLVQVDATDHKRAAQITAANSRSDGVSVDDVADGKEFVIATGGRLVVHAGLTVALGDELVSDDRGRAVPRGTTATTLYNVIGRALTAGDADELITICWGPYSVHGSNAS